MVVLPKNNAGEAYFTYLIVAQVETRRTKGPGFSTSVAWPLHLITGKKKQIKSPSAEPTGLSSLAEAGGDIFGLEPPPGRMKTSGCLRFSYCTLKFSA
jgi:hypothetical protein